MKTLVNDLKAIPDNAVKKNTAAGQLKADLISDGLGEIQAKIFAEVLGIFYESLMENGLSRLNY